MFDLWSYSAGVLVVLAASHLWHRYVYHGARRTRQRERQIHDRLFKRPRPGSP